MTIPEAIEVLRNFKLDMSQPDAFRMVRAIGMAEEALKKQLTLNEILEEIEEEQRSYEADHAWNYARGLEYAANIIRKHMNDGWISVDDRLPEDAEDVIATTENGEEITLAWYGGDDWRSAIDGDSINVIAWMPLPEPYREEKDVGR